MRNLLVCMAAACILATGCSVLGWGYHYDVSNAGNVIPRNENFKLKGALSSYQGTYLIDTNAVYLNMETDIYAGPNHYDTLYEFERFFPNGQYFGSKSFEKAPTKKDFENLTDGTIGYYTFNNGEVVIETFVRNKVGLGDYFFTKCRVNEDILIMYKEKQRCWNCGWSRIRLIYRKAPIENLGGRPTW